MTGARHDKGAIGARHHEGVASVRGRRQHDCCMRLAMLASVFLQKRKCGGYLRGKVSLMFVFIVK